MVTTDKTSLKKEYGTIKVIPMDMAKLNADIDKQIKTELNKGKGSSLLPKLKKNEFFKVRNKLGVVKGTLVVIDDECVGNEGEKITLDIFSETKDSKGQVNSFSIFARFTTDTTITELVKDYAMPETDLATFMSGRFGYNDRILNNMRIIKDEVK